MGRISIWRSAGAAGQMLAVFALASAAGGCGMQLPSIRSPFYLANNSALPVQQHAAGATAHDAGPLPRTIKVERGETLYSLARRHNVSVDELADENGLETHELSAGQQLDLPQIAQR
ncbi:MAG: LysM peptidoglycan-binding domain-containing protein [Alphaproteobacteria bacterium]|nr:LysM peptidoglycan-binding domain-containing protein [Alphaproteobacteria bacterium]